MTVGCISMSRYGKTLCGHFVNTIGQNRFYLKHLVNSVISQWDSTVSLFVWRQIGLAVVGPQRRRLLNSADHRTVRRRLVGWHRSDELVGVLQGLFDPLHVDVRERHNLIRSTAAVVRRVDTLQIVRSAGVSTSQRTTDIYIAGIGRWTTADV